jgi:hypothetical protein
LVFENFVGGLFPAPLGLQLSDVPTAQLTQTCSGRNDICAVGQAGINMDDMNLLTSGPSFQPCWGASSAMSQLHSAPIPAGSTNIGRHERFMCACATAAQPGHTVDALLGRQLSDVPTAQRTQACRQEGWTRTSSNMPCCSESGHSCMVKPYCR